MKRWPTVILSLIAIVFAAYSGYLNMENQRLKKVLALAETTPREEEANVEELEEAPSSEEGEFRGRFEGRFADGERPSREEMLERRRETRTKMMERALLAFDDPELRMDMIEEQMERINRGYADFFASLDLPPEEIDILMTMMAQRNLIRTESGLRASLASEEDREGVKEDYRNQFAILNEDIAALLGDENAQAMQKYTSTMKYRGEVDEFEKTLSYSESPLSKQQSDGMLDVYAKVDQDFEYSVDIKNMGDGRGRGGNNESLTSEMVENYYQEREIYDAMLLEQAASVLNEAQLAELAAQQISERERELRLTQQSLENAAELGIPGGGRGGIGGFTGGRGGFGGRGGGGR